MKNRYLFFKAETFDDLDLSDYTKEGTQIPKTDVHIYTFAYTSTDESADDELQAKKLDELTQLITQKYEGKFQVVSSESSRYFCEKLYPLLAEFETHLRYALYISRAVYDSDNLNAESFLLDAGKTDKNGRLRKCRIEEMVFSEIYTSIFTDASFQSKAKQQTEKHLTKAELIRRIEEIPEETTWCKWVGSQYPYVEDHFLEIKDYRNDVMHSHLINYACYADAKRVLQRAIDEIECIIQDKLITNTSEYANRINLFESIGNITKMAERTAEMIAAVCSKFNPSDMAENMSKALEMFAISALAPLELPEDDLSEDNEAGVGEDEKEILQEDDSAQDKEE